MSTWVDVIEATKIAAGEKKAFVIDNTPILIINVDNEYYAIRNQCTHEDFPLIEGEIENDQIICPLHGARFCFKTGEVKAPPAFENIETFSTRVIENRLQIKK
jgi:3-phenylpropionate/trans-cinnamate dioxygenase ferredoxin subunit